MRRAGFTLIELAVVMAVMGLLTALVLPAVQSAREAARQTVCRNNLRQIGVAVSAFESRDKRLPAGRNAEQDRHHSWATALLGQLDQLVLFNKYDHSRAWDDPTNAAVVESRLAVFRCPSTVDEWPGKTDYGGNLGSTLTGLKPGFSRGRGWEAGTLLVVKMPYEGFRQFPVSMAQVTDGASQTFLVLESADRPAGQGGRWADGHNCFAVDEPINGDGSDEMRSLHPGGAHCLLADGSVRFLSDAMELALLGGLCTRAEGEVTEI